MAAAEQALNATRAATEAEMGRVVTMEKWVISQYTTGRFDSDTRQQK
jgi:hypothetical protein